MLALASALAMRSPSLILLALLPLIGACTTQARAPEPIHVAGYRLTLKAAGSTERLDFSRGEHSLRGQVTLHVDQASPQADSFCAPTLKLTGIYDGRGRNLLGDEDTMRLDVKISNAMRDGTPGDSAGGFGTNTFGFHLDQRVRRLERVQGNLESSHVSRCEVIDVPLANLQEWREIANRCRARAVVNDAPDGGIRVDVMVQLDISDASRASPNAPIRIELVAADTVIDGGTILSGVSRFDRIARTLRFSIDPPEAGGVVAVRLHVVRAVEWREHEFVFEDVPMQGSIRK